MKVKLFCGGDLRLIERQINDFLETLNSSDNPREPERVVDIKYGDHETFSAMVIYK
jgi:hypothetical protein